MHRRIALAGLALLSVPLPLPAPLRAQPAGEWRVGAVFPVSGPAALLGDEAARGLEMAVEAQNAAGGRAVRLLRAEASDAGTALAEARRLIQRERVSLLFGSVAATMGLATLQAAEALDTPFVELVSAADTLVTSGARRFIRTGPSAAAYGRMAADALTHCLPGPLNLPVDALRVGILHEASPTPEAVAAALETALGGANIMIAERVSHSPRSGEWPLLIQRLRAASVNVLIHAAAEGDAAAMLRGLAEAGWRPRVVMGAGPAWGLLDMARALEPALEGVYALDVPPIASASGWAQGAAAFAQVYQRRWGSPPRSGLSLAAYTGARLVLSQGGESGQALRAALAALDHPEGALANGWGWRMDERGQNTRATPVLLQWQAGRPVAVFPPAAAAAAPV
jgi:branched-chain amino acid transport system substrate-binding protein